MWPFDVIFKNYHDYKEISKPEPLKEVLKKDIVDDCLSCRLVGTRFQALLGNIG